MQEILIFASGTIVGTVSTCIAVYLGGNLVMRTYMELTQPHYELPDIVEDNTDTATTDGYDWDEYDDYLRTPHDDKGGEPEA